MSTDKIIPIAAGAASALLTLTMLFGAGGAILLAYLAMLPLFVAAFGWGVRAGQIAAITGAALTFAMGGFVLGLIYFAATAVPAWLVSRQALMGRQLPGGGIHWYPVGHILCQLTALGAIVTTAAAVVHFDVQGGFPSAVAGYVQRFLTVFVPAASEERRAELVATLVPMLPGMTVMSWILMAVLNAVLAQALLVRAGKNQRPSPVYSRIALPDWMSWVWASVALLTLLANGTLEYLGRNLTMILAMPFFFSGLGFIHLLVRQFAVPGLALTVVYTILVFSGWAVLAVAGLGMIERWAGLRTRFAAQFGGPDEEEE